MARLGCRFGFFFVICCLSSMFCSSSGESCYSTDSSPYRMYGTHTDYDDVRGHGTDFTMSGCKPKKFYMLTRHGIRYPTSSSYEFEKHRLPHIQSLAKSYMNRGSMCQRDQDAISHWQYRFHSHSAGQLSETGRQEAAALGLRYRQRFPELLGHTYSSERYSFQHTHSQRTWDTARAMAMAMFNKSDFHMDVASGSCDERLIFYSCCEKFLKTVREQPIPERDSFRNGHEINGVVQSVNARLGLHSDTLSFGDVEAIYDNCAFEHGVFRSSPWCAAFSENDLRVMEYYFDLKYYWEYGYGHSINYEQTCDLMRDIIGYMSSTTTKVTGMIRAAHDLTLMPTYARLGVFHDTIPPTARNMASQSNRKWRTGKLASFNSNIVFVVYDCGSVSKVRFFQNEKPLALPMCPESGCPVSAIVDSYLGSFARHCYWHKTCQYDPKHNCDGHYTQSGTCVPTIIG